MFTKSYLKQLRKEVTLSSDVKRRQPFHALNMTYKRLHPFRAGNSGSFCYPGLYPGLTHEYSGSSFQA
jgi:hypothetical protein